MAIADHLLFVNWTRVYEAPVSLRKMPFLMEPRSLAYHLAMACEAVGVILAQFRTGFPRWEDQYLASIGGLPVAHRLQRALTAGGVGETRLLTNIQLDHATSEGEDRFFCDPQSVESLTLAARKISQWAKGRVVLLVRGDRPLLSERTVTEILSRCPDVSVDAVYEESGAICAIRNPDAILDLLTVLLCSSDTMPADRVTVEASDAGRRIDVFPAVHVHDALRLSAPEDLSQIDRTARRAKAAQLLRNGVHVLDPERSVIDDDVIVGPGTTIFPGAYLRGKTEIGSDCQIGPDAWIEDSFVGDGCTVRYSVVESARVRVASSVGPYAHLRAGADIGPEVRVGNFVEVKAARLEKGVKAGHLSYLGDTQVGEGANIGAGTITCNYDGKTKHRTVIGKDAFVGSHASLVAPVTIGEGALIAAGSTITEDVPDGATAFGRARQVVKRQADESEGEER